MPRTSDQHRRLRAVFDAALQLEPSAREAFVHQACENDQELGPDVMRLLLAHEDTRSFLDHPPELLRSAVLDEEDFTGTWRFRVMRRLGAGGMGVVYEVHDRIRDEVVALKTVRGSGASDLYRLKREFRSLADLVHPNLVCLYELFVEDERGYFTMEMVSGLNFVEYARDTNSARRFQDRIVPALRQLIAGVSALHSRSRLHRDIKPSNVLVTHDGRVVILDFGLIAEPKPDHSGEATYVSGGTPAYMAPEEAAGARPSVAGDWYSVGATLYEALTGTSPFAGSLRDLLYRKMTTDPPAPVELAPDVPADLSSICMGLLRRDPEQRLSGPAALRQLARETASPAVESVSAMTRNAPFVGRESQLRLLNEAFQIVTSGNAAVMCVAGPSGIGKSALVRQFLAQIAGPDDVVVLSGRCYENESVPYKALDGVVDALSRRLESIPLKDLDGLLPSDLAALTRVFPVLLQVHGIAAAQRNQKPESTDPLNVRRQAFNALRELLGQMANRRTLVIHIDDLQWADADSVPLLEDLLRLPSPPRMLTLLSFRSEEIAAKPFLKALLERAGRDIWSAVSLDPLSDDEAQRLIASLLPLDSVLTDHDRHRMTREASGSPFVLEQLARYGRVDRGAPHHVVTFAEMFAARLDAIPADARRFLETLAICRQPMESDLICDACGVEHDRQSLVAMLRASRFIRSSGSLERTELYHDRIRDVLAAGIAPDDTRRIHSRLAQALLDRRSDDFEALFEHHRGAGDAENASIQASLAGEKASRALAFDRAAWFYRHALALSPVSASAHEWRESLANALANAGRPADAADAFLNAAAEAGHLQRVELQRRGAEQLLIGGHIDRGLELIHRMLADMGMAAPRSPRAALLPLLWRRARVRWRGLHFTSKDAADIDSDTLLRLDTCWSATTGLLLVDMISGFAFSARHLLIALDAGEPYRLSRAMAVESAARGASPGGRRLSRQLVQISKELAREVGHPHAIGLSRLAEGLMAVGGGEWRKALTLAEEALAILRDQCVGVTWELNMAQNLVIWALMYLGELGELSRRLPALLAHARSSGNLYIVTELCTRSNFFWLAADDPDEGERVTIESIQRWSHKGFHRQHYSAMLARIQTAFYRGDADAAWGLLGELEAGLRRSYLRRIQVIRVESLYLRGRGALAMAARHGAERRYLSVARASAQRIANERMPWSDPIALLLKAGIAHLQGKTRDAVECLDDAVVRFDRADMKLYAAAARRRCGALKDDARGREMRQQADEWMAAQNIKNPAAMTRMLAPGFTEPA